MIKFLTTIFLLLSFTFPVHAQAVVHKGTLTWVASSSLGVTYSVRRGNTPGGSKTVVRTGIIGLSFVDTPLTQSTLYCYDVIATNATSGDSAASPEVCGSTNKDVTGAPGSPNLVIN